jgi:hypothetical protein
VNPRAFQAATNAVVASEDLNIEKATTEVGRNSTHGSYLLLITIHLEKFVVFCVNYVNVIKQHKEVVLKHGYQNYVLYFVKMSLFVTVSLTCTKRL